jgi:CRP-like cAMP-binding protein
LFLGFEEVVSFPESCYDFEQNVPQVGGKKGSGMHTLTFIQREEQFQKFIVDYKTDEAVFWEGDIAQYFYVILHGKVEIRRTKADGNPLSLAYLEKGQFFGEMALLNRMPRTASAIARTKTKLLVLTEEQLLAIIKIDSHFALKMIRMLCDRLKNLDDVLVKV